MRGHYFFTQTNESLDQGVKTAEIQVIDKTQIHLVCWVIH